MENEPIKGKEEDAEKKISDQMVEKAAATYKWWNNLATLNKEDSFSMSLVKISIRVIGIVILIAISPIAIIALIIAFMAVI